MVATEGWRHAEFELLEYEELKAKVSWQRWAEIKISQMIPEGVELAAIIYTDIERDGMMSGPNVEATAALVKASALPVIASGGVTTVEDIRRLREAGAAGAIIGRALYEGTLTLEAALAAAGE